MQADHIDSITAYTIGSRPRSLFRFSSLILSAFVVLAILYLVIEHYLHNILLAIFLLVGCLFGAFLRRMLSGDIWEWVDLFTKDSAYGFVDHDGVHYCTFLKRHMLRWAGVQRLEYWPGNGNRINIYLFGRKSPIRFGPMNQDDNALRTIKASLERLNAKTSFFVMGTDNPSEMDDPFGVIPPIPFAHWSIGRQWLARAALLVLTGFFSWHLIRAKPPLRAIVDALVAVIFILFFLDTFRKRQSAVVKK